MRCLDHRERWVFRTAFNLARSRVRRLTAERRAHRRLQAGAAEAVVLPDTASAVAVRAAVAALPERQRATIVARFYLGLDVAEAAEVLDCKTGTIKALTHQAMAGLRRSGLVDLEEVTPNG